MNNFLSRLSWLITVRPWVTLLVLLLVTVALAAVTTIASLLASLFSPIGMVGDFGIISGLGIGLSLIVMLTLLPAARTIIDRRRERRGTLPPARPISTALPGIEKTAEFLGRAVTRRPAPYIIVVIAVTVALGFAATGLKSEYSIRDLLPRGGSVLEDLNTLDTAVGGSTEMTSVLVTGEATETRTLLNVQDLESAFESDATRPGAAAGPILASYELLIRDWTHNSGQPGDKYDAEMASLFKQASADVHLNRELMQQILDRLETLDPLSAHLLANNPEGTDAILIQFPAYTGDPAATKELQQDIENLWFGEDDTITATSDSIISFAVTDAIRDRQTESIGTTAAVATTGSALLGSALTTALGIGVMILSPLAALQQFGITAAITILTYCLTGAKPAQSVFRIRLSG